MDLITIDIDLYGPLLNLAETPYKSALEVHDIYVVGDLHGNFAKLVLALINLNFIALKNPEYFIDTNCIVHLLRQFSEHDLTKQEIHEHLDLLFFVRPSEKEIIFIGDIICDRGISDYFTISIFYWMARVGIKFSCIFGNHDIVALTSYPFSQHRKHKYFIDLIGSNSFTAFFRSFDYFRLDEKRKQEFVHMCRELLIGHFNFFRIIPSSKMPILLTHAPVHPELFNQLINMFLIEQKREDRCPTWHDLFIEQATSNKFVFDFRRWIHKRLTVAFDFAIDENEKKFWGLIKRFCFWRDDMSPFFHHSAQSKTAKLATVDAAAVALGKVVNDLSIYTIFDIPYQLRFGTHIFGHMAGVYINPHPEHLTHSQICLDTTTGMPHLSAGPIIYALI